MDTEPLKPIIVVFDVLTNEYVEREATDEEIANWPKPFGEQSANDLNFNPTS
jgi:hypothetical protein